MEKEMVKLKFFLEICLQSPESHYWWRKVEAWKNIKTNSKSLENFLTCLKHSS